MGRPKKVIVAKEEVIIDPLIIIPSYPEVVPEAVPTFTPKLSIDYPSEGLNDMARKINEIIEFISLKS